MVIAIVILPMKIKEYICTAYRSGSLNVLMRPGKKKESTGTSSFVPSLNSSIKNVKRTSTEREK